MRILIISTYFPPHNAIASWRPYSWAKCWAEAGHDVTVLTTDKKKDSDLIQDHPWTGFNVIEVSQGRWFHYLRHQYRAPASLPHKKTWVQKALKKPFEWFQSIRLRTGIFHAARMPDFTDLWVLPALHAVQNMSPWDLAISSYGPPASHAVGYRLKKRGQVKRWIADYRDLWLGRDNMPGIFPMNLIEEWLERRFIAHADALTVVSEGLASVMRKRFPSQPVYVIENGFDPTDLSALDPSPVFPKDGKVRIVYTGVIYHKIQDLTPLFKSVQQIAQDEQYRPLLERLEIVFAGDLMGPLDKLVEQWQVHPWVKPIGQVTRREALRMQRDADHLLLLGVRDKGLLLGKTYEYLFSKRPIFAIGLANDHPLTHLIHEAKAGIVFDQEVSEIKQFLMQQLQTQHRAPSHTRNEVIHRYDRRTLAKRLLECVTSEKRA